MVSNVKQTVQKLSGAAIMIHVKTLRGAQQCSLPRSLENALLFVLMNVDYLSRVVHFDRDLSADSDIPEHAVLGSEAKTPLPSRRRQRHLGLAIINR
jgi:hypothetical protein